MQDLNIIYQDPTGLKARPNNARTHSKQQIEKLEQSVSTFGFNNPVLVDSDNNIIAGHGRIEAAKRMGLTGVPTIRIEHLTQAQIKAYALADNQLALLAGWDEELLKIEVLDIINLDPALDLTVTGFETAELDRIMLLDDEEQELEDSPEELLRPDAVSQKGDLWLLGPHRILCGDALQLQDYARLMADDKAQVIFTDPPYNVKIKNIVGNGETQHDEFVMASGEMNYDEFIAFLKTAFTHMALFSEDGSIHYICMDWRHLAELLAAGKDVYDALLNMCVWNKTNGGMGSFYRSKHEEVGVFKKGKAPHINNVQLGKHGRYRTNVWDYAGQNTFHADREEELGSHPTVKPVQLVADAILDASHRNGIVLDPFGGSGTTLLAAEKAGRQARLIEYEPVYVDLTVRRWQLQTGQIAIHAETGMTFDEIAAKKEKNND
jgi:DNA modification methylase